MPSPGGQVSGMAGKSASSAQFVGGPVGVPSRLTSPGAITPYQGGKPGNAPHYGTKVAPLIRRDRATPGQTGWHPQASCLASSAYLARG